MYCSIKNYLLQEQPKLADLFQGFCMLDYFSQGPYTLLVPQDSDVNSLSTMYSKVQKTKSAEERKEIYDELRTRLRAIVIPASYPNLNQGMVTCQTLATSKDIYRTLDVRDGVVVSPFSGKDVSLVKDPSRFTCTTRMRAPGNSGDFVDRFAVFFIKGPYFAADKGAKEKMSGRKPIVRRGRKRGGGYFDHPSETRGICVKVIEHTLATDDPAKIHALRLLASYNYELFFALLRFSNCELPKDAREHSADASSFFAAVDRLFEKSDSLITERGKSLSGMLSAIAAKAQSIGSPDEYKRAYAEIGNAFKDTFGLDLSVEDKLEADGIRRFFDDHQDTSYNLYHLFCRICRSGDSALPTEEFGRFFFAIPTDQGDSRVAAYERGAKANMA